MKNKILLLAFILLILMPSRVYAYSKYDCTYEQQVRLRKLASNVMASYDYIENNNNVTFSITLTNINKEIYVENKKTNQKYYYNNAKEITIDGFTPGQNVELIIYATKENCIGSYLAVKHVSLPSFNKYYSDSLCKDKQGNKLCNKWNRVSLSYDEFKKSLNETTKSNNSEEEAKAKKSIIELVINFLLKYYIYICIGLIIIILPVLYIHSKKNKIDL